MLIHLVTILIALTLIWFCSGQVLDTVNGLASRFRLPKFSFSLLLLGLLTSIPEASVAINSLLIGEPEVSLGNLIGGQVLLLFCIIPILALRRRGLHFHYPLQPKTIALTLATNVLPLYALVNHYVSFLEAVAMLILFFFFTAVFVTDLEQEHQALPKLRIKQKKIPQSRVFTSLVRLIVCVLVIFLASNRLVHDVITFANFFSLHPFFVSLFVIAIGTNIPEITLTVRAILSRKTDIALGNYIGSATTNTLIAALVVLATNGVRVSMPTAPLLIPIAGSGIFWWFARSKRTLSAPEASVLIMIALSFFGLMTWLEVR